VPHSHALHENTVGAGIEPRWRRSHWSMSAKRVSARSLKIQLMMMCKKLLFMMSLILGLGEILREMSLMILHQEMPEKLSFYENNIHYGVLFFVESSRSTNILLF
jgi:hypothetical protein